MSKIHNGFKQYEYGFTAGQFDIIHPGYINLFEETKAFCKTLIIGLNASPENKLPPIFSIADRKRILESIEYIDEVVIYFGEEALLELLDSFKNLNIIRVVGDEYLQKETFTGKDVIPVYYRNTKGEWRYSQVLEAINDKMVHGIRTAKVVV